MKFDFLKIVGKFSVSDEVNKKTRVIGCVIPHRKTLHEATTLKLKYIAS